mmetsp:Transcript_20495/g.38961  ORF Transcript_20495/g.38961 Transcript_20495/m.38961 type:complete len:214 (-) Transcript_20495:394-1035(-)
MVREHKRVVVRQQVPRLVGVAVAQAQEHGEEVQRARAGVLEVEGGVGEEAQPRRAHGEALLLPRWSCGPQSPGEVPELQPGQGALARAGSHEEPPAVSRRLREVRGVVGPGLVEGAPSEHAHRHLAHGHVAAPQRLPSPAARALVVHSCGPAAVGPARRRRLRSAGALSDPRSLLHAYGLNIRNGRPSSCAEPLVQGICILANPCVRCGLLTL